jgi:hypothetical protein
VNQRNGDGPAPSQLEKIRVTVARDPSPYTGEVSLRWSIVRWYAEGHVTATGIASEGDVADLSRSLADAIDGALGVKLQKR